MDRIRAEFTQRPGTRTAAPLWRLAIGDTEPGMDARATCTHDNVPGEAHHSSDGRSPVILAELHPDTLPTRPPHSRYGSTEQGAMDDGWPGFLHRVHRLLCGGGLLLLATRQRRDAGGLTDPLGMLIACARTAGFRYLQHIVIVHGTPLDDRILPQTPHDAPPGLMHSDLLILNVAGSTP